MMRKLIRRLRYLVHRDRHARELADEMDFHRSLLGDAGNRTRNRSFGNSTLALEDAHAVWVPELFDAIWRDLRYGMRMLRREPTFAATAIATLAIGVLTVTTAFTVVDAQLWRPLPFPHPHQLIVVAPTGPGTSGYEDVSGPDFFTWRSQSRLAGYAAIGPFDTHTLKTDTSSESILAMAVSGNFFDVLEARPAIGRSFDESDERGTHVAMLSYHAWSARFHADPAVVGRTIVLDRDACIVVGVAPASGLQFTQEPDIYLPIDRSAADLASWTTHSLDIVGRLAPGATLPQADSELQAIETNNASAAPAAHAGHHVHLDALRWNYYYIGSEWRSLYFFLAAAALVMLLACGNVAHLLLARALRRQQEFAIRGALGGGRRALARQLLVEGSLLATPGVVLGALSAYWTLAILATRIPSAYLTRGGPLTLDLRTVFFAAVMAAATTIALARAPLLFARRIDLNPMLRHAVRTAGGPPRQARLRHALVIGQMTITLVLLAGAGLFIVSFVKLTRTPLGFEPSNRLAIRLNAGEPRGDDGFVRAFAGRVLDQARAIPGVASTAVSSSAPLEGAHAVTFVVEGSARPSSGDEPIALFRAISPNYFRMFGIQLVAGREFSSSDGPGSLRVAIVNDHLVKRFFPDGQAIGRRLELLPGRSRVMNRPGEVEIVGIAPHVKDMGINEADFDDVYVPFSQAPMASFEVLVHASIASGSVVPPLRQTIASIDSTVTTGAITTFAERVDRALATDRFNTQLIVSFAAVAILLAFAGIYGTMAYAMEERTREFGIRLALGASPSEILRAVLWRSARLGIAGALFGACAALAGARLLGSELYLVPGVHGGLLVGVSAYDPRVLSAAVVGLIGVSIIAGLVPASHAMRVDPAVTLKE